MAQLMPLLLTVSCFSKIQIGFTFLVPAHPGSPGKRAIKRVCVCVYVISLQRLMLETSNFVHGSAMWSLSLVMSECSLSGHGEGHVSNFYIVDLENLATASRRYTGDIHNTSVVGLLMTPMGQWKRLERVMVECTCFITHGPTVTLQLNNFDFFRTCRTSSFCTVVWQLARFQLTRCIARSLGDSWASC